ncbi:8-oxo-dGTP diphosphatase MutT [Vibrio rumoiensis]|uniref:8-oxo-dGTP diphosphatase n=1 Tax=Vibrio rumoiensis 1S-45 TaxID=1188252 RepID=A0A1E5E1F0_9VIBR|nr:8-oxo-dGTP diphosphatase MutT [Vibrio rumoiensis]OEF24970.1 7,8-dihydro-8-oxoguanine-triphosphatase [Vibrio rumoiensis 1S-45]
MTRLHIVAAIILNADKDQIFITKRPAKLHKGGFWEFPGGKVEESESAQQGLVRELQEEIDITATQMTLFEHFDFDYPEKSLTFDFFVVSDFNGQPYGKEGQEGQWVAIGELKNYSFPEANVPVLEKVIACFAASTLG